MRFQSINAIRTIENCCFKHEGHPEHRKGLFKKHKWHSEHRKVLSQSINGIWIIENVYFKT